LTRAPCVLVLFNLYPPVTRKRRLRYILKESLPACMGVGSRGAMPLWTFIRGTDIVVRGLRVLFFGLFFVVSPPRRGLIVLFFCLFSVTPFPPWKFFYRRPCPLRSCRLSKCSGWFSDFSISLLLVQSHQAEIIAISTLSKDTTIYATWVRVESRSYDHSRHKNDVIRLSETLPMVCSVGNSEVLFFQFDDTAST